LANSFPVLLVAGCIDDKVDAKLHPPEEGKEVGDVAKGGSVDDPDEDCRDVAAEAAEAGEDDGGGHSMVAGRQLMLQVLTEKQWDDNT
jgi:hypothetical protein